MSYNPNVPLSNQTISATQAPIQTNFSVANTAFGIDHTAFNDNTNQGMHKKVTLQAPLGSNPDQVSPIASLYTKDVNGSSELFYQNNVGTGAVEQLTGLALGAASTGYLKLPSGIIMKWGSVSGGPGANTTSFPVGSGIPVFSNIFTMYVTTVDNTGIPDSYAQLQTYTTTNFKIFNTTRSNLNPSGASCTYLAIGN